MVAATDSMAAMMIMMAVVGARTVFGPKRTAPPLIHAPQGVVFSFLSFNHAYL